MKEIKFRAIGINSKELVYSMTISNGTIKRKRYNVFFEVDEKWIGVIPETVGQYTGLKDKNDIDIYEGDILKLTDDNEKFNPIIVGWSNRFASFILNRKGWLFGHWFGESCDPEDVEIIGNIHESPKLLK